jgi:hypothetical protein
MGSSGVIKLAEGGGNDGGWCLLYRFGKPDIGMSSMAVIGASSNAVIGGVQRSPIVLKLLSWVVLVETAGGETESVEIANLGRADIWVDGIRASMASDE